VEADVTRWVVSFALAVALTGCAHRGPGTGGGSGSGPAAVDPKVQRLQGWIREVMSADYAGDRAALDRLYLEADAYLADTTVESRVRYWKGFAKWRRAMNGANEEITPTDLASDVEVAADQLRRSGELDPGFVDARIGEMQCLGLMLFFDRERADAERIARLRALMADLKDTAADNPRYVWAWGMAYFTMPPERGGGPANVIPAYLKALDRARSGAGAGRTPLDPSWGEPELCVNLAYSYLNQPTPDLALARTYVDDALRLVPSWHYARDILRPQIDAAAAKAAGDGR
jgi:hypothetical protein